MKNVETDVETETLELGEEREQRKDIYRGGDMKRPNGKFMIHYKENTTEN